MVYNKEFIYREKLHTKLNEVTSRLTAIYKKAVLVQSETVLERKRLEARNFLKNSNTANNSNSSTNISNSNISTSSYSTNLAHLHQQINSKSASDLSKNTNASTSLSNSSIKAAPTFDFIYITFVEPYKNLPLEIHQCDSNEYYDINSFTDTFVYSSPLILENNCTSASYSSLSQNNNNNDSKSPIHLAKRKVILKTKYEFPGTQTRIQVISRSESLISPCQMAIDDLLKKIHQIENHVNEITQTYNKLFIEHHSNLNSNQNQLTSDHDNYSYFNNDNQFTSSNHNLMKVSSSSNWNSIIRSNNLLKNHRKTLQLVLGGAVSPTVHSGPLELANAFLLPYFENYKRTIDEILLTNIIQQPNINKNNQHQLVLLPHSNFENIQSDFKLLDKLRLCMLRLLYVCGSAIKINGLIIDENQEDYHKQLEMDFSNLKEKLSEIVVVPK